MSKSGYYDWHGRAPSKRTTANVTLLVQIEAAHALSDATHGLPRIRGVSRSYVLTTTRDKRQRPAPDLVRRQFVATLLAEATAHPANASLLAPSTYASILRVAP